ncbi:MAG: extracellular solute-binding protein [Spirochaetaceae bacterium]|jgi:spermidine/putrescine transport system substrate-binding protein|nr:extracellular solute-binding protein [Spirochaetaceae bacterium]
MIPPPFLKKFLLAASVLVTLVFGACDSKEKLYLYNWTYYTPHDVIEKFEDEYNCEVIYDDFDSNETMYAKIQTGGSNWDIIFPSGDYTSIMIKNDMLEKIDKSRLSNLGNIDPELLQRVTYDPDMEYSVPYYWGAAGICLNKSKIPSYEQSWSIFGRSDLAGKMTMLDDMREVMGDALIFLGYSVNSTDLDEIAAARDLIEKTWKPNLGRFDSDSFGKNYASGAFWLVQGYPESVFREIQGNKELEENTVFFIPQEGGSAYIDSMCILKGAKNIDLAHKFIDFMHRPNIYAEFCDTFRFPSTVNIPARVLLKKKPMYNISDLMKTELKEDVGPALDIYIDAWLDTIRVGG